jgi:hypothetical protein
MKNSPKTRDTPHFSLVAALGSLVLYKYWGVSLVLCEKQLKQLGTLPMLLGNMGSAPNGAIKFVN